ncbi:ribonuclease H-like domain-containing protein, partial [Tanacetum coccineum]
EKNGTTQWLSHINSWTSYAITRNIQEVYLDVHDSEGQVWYDDELLFNNSCITSMIIVNYFFDPPNGGIRWDKLKSLCMVHVLLGEDVIANILSRSPALESLDLYNCYGFEWIDVTSRSVKNLEFYKFPRDPWQMDYMDTLEINAPYILSLTINSCLYLEKRLLLMLGFNKLGNQFSYEYTAEWI